MPDWASGIAVHGEIAAHEVGETGVAADADEVDGKRGDREAADAGDGEGSMAEQDRLDRRLDRSRCAGCK